MKFLQNGILAVVVAVAATGVYLYGVVTLELYVTFLGLGGFAGIAGLRSAIQSSGFKTYIIAGGGSIVSISVALGFATVENALVVLAVLGIGAVASLAHGIQKANG